MIQVHSRVPVSAAMRNVLHWLSFPQRVTFKLCMLSYKCLHGLAPQYLSLCCVPIAAVTGQSQLCSADERHLLLSRTSIVMLGLRAFYSSGPASWNSLPTVLQHPDLTLGAFKWQLKTVLFMLMQEDLGPVHHVHLRDVFALTVRIATTVYLLTYITQFQLHTHTAVSITQQLVNDVTELPRDHRMLLDWQPASHVPEQYCTLVMM